MIFKWKQLIFIHILSAFSVILLSIHSAILPAPVKPLRHGMTAETETVPLWQQKGSLQFRFSKSSADCAAVRLSIFLLRVQKPLISHSGVFGIQENHLY